MDHEPEYSKYALHELLDAARHIDRERYRDRAQRIDEEIARRSKENEACLETISIDDEIERRIRIIRWIYAGLALLGGIATLLNCWDCKCNTRPSKHSKEL